MKSVAVLLSGRGSNLEALLAASPGSHYRIVGVVSNRPAARGLEIARRHGLPAAVVDHAAFPGRTDFERQLTRALHAWHPDLVVLAGFMRILTDDFVRRHAGRMLNVHPSLLPAFPGLDTHRRVLEAGHGDHGASVHFVTPELDLGPVIAQVRMSVRPGDSPETLAARLLPLEHELLPFTVDLVACGRAKLRSGRVELDGKPLDAPICLDRRDRR